METYKDYQEINKEGWEPKVGDWFIYGNTRSHVYCIEDLACGVRGQEWRCRTYRWPSLQQDSVTTFEARGQFHWSSVKPVTMLKEVFVGAPAVPVRKLSYEVQSYA